MKTVFIINPKAGTRFEETLNQIKSSDVEYYITKAPKDAKEYVGIDRLLEEGHVN